MVDGMRNAPQQKVSLVGPGSCMVYLIKMTYSTVTANTAQAKYQF